jgi:hypothetical protein
MQTGMSAANSGHGQPMDRLPAIFSKFISNGHTVADKPLGWIMAVQGTRAP